MTAEGPIAQEMREKLEAEFHPTRLDIIDESEAHRGHAGFQEGGQSHFRIRIDAPGFSSMSRLDRHRAIHRALGKGIIGRIHALALDVNG